MIFYKLYLRNIDVNNHMDIRLYLALLPTEGFFKITGDIWGRLLVFYIVFRPKFILILNPGDDPSSSASIDTLPLVIILYYLSLSRLTGTLAPIN